MGCHRKLPHGLCTQFWDRHWPHGDSAPTQHLWVVQISSDLPGSLAFALKRQSGQIPTSQLSTLIKQMLHQAPSTSAVSNANMAAWGFSTSIYPMSCSQNKSSFPQTHDLGPMWDAGKKWSEVCFLTEVMCAHICHSGTEHDCSPFQGGRPQKREEICRNKGTSYLPADQDWGWSASPCPGSACGHASPLLEASLRSPEFWPLGISSTAPCLLFIHDSVFSFSSLLQNTIQNSTDTLHHTKWRTEAISRFLKSISGWIAK